MSRNKIVITSVLLLIMLISIIGITHIKNTKLDSYNNYTLSLEDFINIKYNLKDKIDTSNKRVKRSNTDNYVTYTSDEYIDDNYVLVSEIYNNNFYIAKYKSSNSNDEHLYICTKDSITEINSSKHLSDIVNNEYIPSDTITTIISKLESNNYIDLFNSSNKYEVFKDKLNIIDISQLKVESCLLGSKEIDMVNLDTLLVECSSNNKNVYLDIQLENNKINNIDILRVIEN